MRRVTCVGLAVVLGASCGSFDNRRFESGQGRIEGTTLAGADVWVLGRPDLATVADDGGAFAVGGAPAGAVTLLVSGAKGAGLREVTVIGGATARAGDVSLAAPFSVEGTAPAGVLVWVPGTSLVDRAGPDGAFMLGGLPAGCLPIAVDGTPARVCGAEGDVVRPAVAAVSTPCGSDTDCPIGVACAAGACQADECYGAHACEGARECRGGGCCQCASGETGACGGAGDGFVCDGCLCVEGPPCEPTAEICNGADDDCDGEVDEGLGVGGRCGPPGQCGEGVLECGAGGARVCTSAPDVAECTGFGPVMALTDLRFAGGRAGFDLDDADHDGDPTTGTDNAMGGLASLLDLAGQALRRALRMPGEGDATYLLELAGLGPDGTPAAGGGPVRLRLYLARELDDGAFEVLWSVLGEEGLPLGDLPVAVDQSEGVWLAGPAPLTLHVSAGDDRYPLELLTAYMAVGRDPAAPMTGSVGGAVRIAGLLDFIGDAHVRSFLETVLSPGDVDLDGDGQRDALSLALTFSARPASLSAARD